MKNLIRVLCFVFLLSSCTSTDKERIVLTEFNDKIDVVLIPYENKTYVSWVIKANGYVNDTIKITRDGYYDISLTGQIDTLINGDYYGDFEVVYIIDPHKASKGNLEIELSL